MIKTKNIVKRFGDFKAVNDVSFEIDRGEIVGFLGQNGAGKTTLMRIMTTFLPATSGSITIDGLDVSKHSLDVRKKIGYLPETPPLYPTMTVKNYLLYAAQLKNVKARDQRGRVDCVLDECNIVEVKNKLIENLSKGYKQRVGIAQAIINDPELLILDEPTNGLDPVQILQVRRLIKNLEAKRTVIISTHILSEIEQIAKRVIIIKNGTVLKDANLEDLLMTDGQQHTTLEEVFLKDVVDKEV